jgi:pimeloyl-ACP methyl ester carboxylesterase
MSSRAKRAGLLGALVGVAAAGVAGGIAVERLVLRHGRPQPVDPYVAEPFDELPFTDALTVRTGDGVDLHVEIVEPAGPAPPDLTVIFVHGYALDMGTFHFQRRELAGLSEPRLRCVFYDQPGHGRSSRQPDGEYRIEALGADLRTVIDRVAPEGPLALVGHSMGGMAIMALAEQCPGLVAERVRAVALISTSAGRLSDVGFGLPRVLTGTRKRVLPLLAGAAKLTPAMIDRARGAATEVTYLLTRRYGFGVEPPSPALVRYVERMNERTSIDVIASYLDTLFAHDRYSALEALSTTEVLVIVGEADLITPLAHAEEIHRLLPDSTLTVVPGAGHMALLEYPELVGAPLRKLLDRAAADQPTG